MKRNSIDNPIIMVCTQNFNGYGVLRSLSKIGVKPFVLCDRRPRNPVIKLSRHRGKILYYDNVEEIPDILIQEFSHFNKKPVVICCDDALQSIVDCHYNDLCKFFILANINNKEGEITRLMDKDRQMKIAASCGMTIPRTWSLSKNAELPEDMTYPCIVKAQVSIHGSKDEMLICHNDNELKKRLALSGHLVQQFINKDYEIIIYGTSVGKGKYYMPGVTKKIRQYPDENGMSSFCALEGFEKYPGLDTSAILCFLSSLNYIGMFSIEMAVKDNKFYLLEINLRNDGKQYFSTAAGANLPELYIKSQLNLSFDLPSPKYPTYAMGELTDFYQIGKVPGFSFWKWIQDLMRTDTFFILNLSDPLPGLSDCYNLLRFKINGLLSKLGIKYRL